MNIILGRVDRPQVKMFSPTSQTDPSSHERDSTSRNTLTVAHIQNLDFNGTAKKASDKTFSFKHSSSKHMLEADRTDQYNDYQSPNIVGSFRPSKANLHGFSDQKGGSLIQPDESTNKFLYAASNRSSIAVQTQA